MHDCGSSNGIQTQFNKLASSRLKVELVVVTGVYAGTFRLDYDRQFVCEPAC